MSAKFPRGGGSRTFFSSKSSIGDNQKLWRAAIFRLSDVTKPYLNMNKTKLLVSCLSFLFGFAFLLILFEISELKNMCR